MSVNDGFVFRTVAYYDKDFHFIKSTDLRPRATNYVFVPAEPDFCYVKVAITKTDDT